MAGYLSSVNLIAAAGILGNVGGVPIAANSTAISDISAFNSLGVIAQFSNVKLTGNSVLSSGVVANLNNLAGNTFPVVTNAVPSSYIGSLGNTSIAGFTSVVSTEINNIMGNGDLGIFEQVIGQADAYRITTNQLITSAVNANDAAAISTYTTQDNTMSGGLSQISQAYEIFGEELTALGYSIDFASLSDLGSPQALLRQIFNQSGGSTVINTALLNAGLSADTLVTLESTPMTNEEQKIVFDVMQTVTGNQLKQILYLLKVTTPGLGTLADLLNPVKMFPASFNTLTAPTVDGIRGIYINSSGAVNSKLATTLPSNVLGPVQGYQTVENTYAQLKKIIPADWALSNKAIQAGLEQVKSIFGSTAPLLGIATVELESNKGLDLINALTTPLPTSVSDFFANNYSSGTGENGTLLLADIIGTAGGWVVNDSLSTAISTITELNSAGQLTTLTDGTTGVFTVMQNAIDGVYGIPDGMGNVLTIPPGLPGTGTYDTYNLTFTGPGTPGTGLLPAAYSLIGNIVANNSSNVTIANSAWANIAAQLVLESTTQGQADIVFANLVPGTQPSSLATDVGDYGLDNSVGGAAWFFESVANTSTLGGQAIISSMREARNQVRLQSAGVSDDIEVSDTTVEPQQSLSSGQYTLAEAESQKII
jgi:hypothetical protein